MDAALRQFFTSPAFAVAGASSNPAKFGHKVLCWYLGRDLPATPLNPASATVTTTYGELEAVKSPAALQNPERYALSVITPPPVTQTLLEEAKKVGIRAVWLQPGTFDDKVLAYARKEWPDAAIAGTDVPGTVGGEGWCVLVDGDSAMKLAGRKPGEKL